MRYSTHQLLCVGNTLEVEDCLDLGFKIKHSITNLNLYEYSMTNNNILLVINPSPEALNDGFKLNPLSNQTRNFFMNLSEFLRCQESIEVQ